jgi:hypothetical protein
MYVSEGDLGVFLADFDLYGVFVGEELELFQSSLEVLDLSED